MDNVALKPAYRSVTIISAVTCAVIALLAVFGVQVPPDALALLGLDVDPELSAAITHAVAGVLAVIAVWGRINATATIGAAGSVPPFAAGLAGMKAPLQSLTIKTAGSSAGLSAVGAALASANGSGGMLLNLGAGILALISAWGRYRATARID